jgi:Cu/Ag efflux pump CusA
MATSTAVARDIPARLEQLPVLNGVVLVSFMNQLRDEGRSVDAAVREGVRALEPHVNAIKIAVFVVATSMWASAIVGMVFLWRSP